VLPLWAARAITQFLGAGPGLFAAAWGIAPFKQITSCKKQISCLEAAKLLPADQLNMMIFEGARAALTAP